MPPPLAVIWRTWPQILSPFTIWAVLSWLQGGFSCRLIPPSSPVACQVRLKVRLTESGFLMVGHHLFRTSSKCSYSWFIHYRDPSFCHNVAFIPLHPIHTVALALLRSQRLVVFAPLRSQRPAVLAPLRSQRLVVFAPLPPYTLYG